MTSKGFAPVVSLHPATYGIGRNGQLPWRVKEDMAFFKDITSIAPCGLRNAVVMGRKTWESLPAKFRPLQNRLNVVLSSDANVRTKYALPDEVLSFASLSEAVNALDQDATVASVFIIGGESLYREAVASPLCRKIYVTEIFGEFEGFDTFFPRVPADSYRLSKRTKSQPSSTAGITYRFVEYDAVEEVCDSVAVPSSLPPQPMLSVRNTEELQYLDLVRDIIETGVLRGDRTGTGTVSKFGVQMRFSLRNNVFPLITTKRVFWRGVAEELLWFVKGSTNAKELQEKKIHIWDGNASRQFLDSRGLTDREEGDLGPVYGFQWRHFGAKYTNMHSDYTGQGIDQLQDCIHKIKTSPEDRRIIMTAWNPADLNLMALPPCHMFCQFYVANGELSCHMYQRSADMGLGVPFNIASYALLTRMMAQACGLKAGDFVHSIGDAHVYVNHIEALKVQLTREPKPFPTLSINPAVTDIDGFQFADFTVENYQPDAAIKMDMAV